MGKYSAQNKKIKELIDNTTEYFDTGVSVFLSWEEEELKRAKKFYKNSRRGCILILAIVWGICGAIIYFHIM